MALVDGQSATQHATFQQFRTTVCPMVRLARADFFAPLQHVKRADLGQSFDAVLTAAAIFRDQGHGETEGIATYAQSRLAAEAVDELEIVKKVVVEDLEKGEQRTTDRLGLAIEKYRSGAVDAELTNQDRVAVLRQINIREAAAGAAALRANVLMLLQELDPVADDPAPPSEVNPDPTAEGSVNAPDNPQGGSNPDGSTTSVTSSESGGQSSEGGGASSESGGASSTSEEVPSSPGSVAPTAQ